MISIAFGNRVKLLRKSNNYTQIQLAKKVGITQAYLCMIESGGLVPSYPVIYKLADVLHTTTDYLLPEKYEWMPFFSRVESSRWIQCTKRLPDKSGRYLVTRGSNVCGGLWNKVDILNYSDLMGLTKEKIWWSGNVGKSDFEKCDHVIAWMPLPEPYKTDTENEKV